MKKQPKRQESDPVVAEVRAAKERLSSKFGHDVELMLRDAQRKQRAGGRRVVSLARHKATLAR